jgi:hypothetical protein
MDFIKKMAVIIVILVLLIIGSFVWILSSGGDYEVNSGSGVNPNEGVNTDNSLGEVVEPLEGDLIVQSGEDSTAEIGEIINETDIIVDGNVAPELDSDLTSVRPSFLDN